MNTIKRNLEFIYIVALPVGAVLGAAVARLIG